jgi:hypothetical protein
METYEVRVFPRAETFVIIISYFVSSRQACGENLKRYGTRMDALWAFRAAYNEARKVKRMQDDFCAKAEGGQWDQLTEHQFPESLQWEMLVDVLRGRVKVRE